MWGEGYESHYAEILASLEKTRDFGMTEGMEGKGISLTMREIPRPAGENAGSSG